MYCAKQAEIFSFIVGFYLVFIFQFITGVTGNNISNLILIIISFTCGYMIYKLLLKVPVKKIEIEEQEKGKLKGYDLFIFRVAIAIFIITLMYFNPTASYDYIYRR